MIKVMSFNIRYGLAEDGKNHWKKRKSLVLERIQAFGPDLLGLQECRDDAQAEFIKTKLPEYHFYGVRREGGGDTALEMAPVLFRKSMFGLIQFGTFWLSETPQSAGSKSWDSEFARTASWVELFHYKSGKSLMYLNTHFDYQPAAIDHSSRLLGEWAGQAGRNIPVVISGDFNANKDSAAYRHLLAKGRLADAYRLVNPGGRAEEATFHAYGQPDQLSPIDWILVSHNLKVMEAAVDHAHKDGVFPSDHYPVTAVLDFESAE